MNSTHNKHLEKTERNERIRELLVSGWSQSQVAREYNVTVQRVNMLVDRFIRQGLLEKTKKGFVIPKGRSTNSNNS